MHVYACALLQDASKRFPNEQTTVRAELLELLTQQLFYSSTFQLHSLHEHQLAVLLQLGKQAMQAKDSTCGDVAAVMQMADGFIAAASKPAALQQQLQQQQSQGAGSAMDTTSSTSSSAGGSSSASANTGSSGDWRGPYGSMRYVLTACAAELLAQAMAVHTPHSVISVLQRQCNPANVQHSRWEASWPHSDNTTAAAVAPAAATVTAGQRSSAAAVDGASGLPA